MNKYPQLAATETPACVLVVDDSAAICSLIACWLRKAGYACLTANSVDEAISLLQNNTVDLVISDIFMRERTGFDLLAYLKSELSQVAVLMLTGSGSPHLAAQAMNNGAWGYMTKPVTQESLLFQVGTNLDLKRRFSDSLLQSQELVHQLQEQTRLMQLAHNETIQRLVATSMVRDDETGAHIRRIGQMSGMLAKAIGWPAEQVEHIGLAASMHDIGKVGIPDAILCKPGKLTSEEFEVMKTHSVIGAGILKNSEFPMVQMAEVIARSHHERWDGSGYPDGLRGEEIPAAARIVTIVDFYDALVHDRVYRPAVPEPEVLQMMQAGRGKHFDPQLLDTFFTILPMIREISDEETIDEPRDADHGLVKLTSAASHSTVHQNIGTTV